MQILTIHKGFEAFQSKFEPFKPNSKHLNANSKPSNDIQLVLDGTVYF